jgi:hypothetical protein
MATLKTVAGNTAPPLVITCERDGAAINLTGCTVQLIIAKGATITQAGRTATLTTAASGIITYTPLVTDFPSAGTYKGDVKVTYGDGSIEILYEQLKMKARAALS